MGATEAGTQDLLDYIAASPTPHHCVAESASRLEAAGFTDLDEAAAWALDPGSGYFVRRGGAIVAIQLGTVPAVEAGFRIVGAHTDSPNLRVKPVPDVSAAGYRQLGVEVYGGALTYTWLDRDLGLAGPVYLIGEGPGGVEERLLRIDRPVLRVPSLAIHLSRELRSDGLKLNPQKHLAPVLALAEGDGPTGTSALRALVAAELECDADRVLSWDLSLFDLAAPVVGGAAGEFLFSARLDNQAMCHAALTALTRVSKDAVRATRVICLYDHEEVGSGSSTGAAGPLVESVLERVVGGDAQALARAAARSIQVSADMAHAIHPNYADRHEPAHQPKLNGGPVIKINAQQRYATSGEAAAYFEALANAAGVPIQKFVVRTDLACGGTIGPISSARLGIRTVDVGNPMLSMHSIREQAGAHDPERMVTVLARLFQE